MVVVTVLAVARDVVEQVNMNHEGWHDINTYTSMNCTSTLYLSEMLQKHNGEGA